MDTSELETILTDLSDKIGELSERIDKFDYLINDKNEGLRAELSHTRERISQEVAKLKNPLS